MKNRTRSQRVMFVLVWSLAAPVFAGEGFGMLKKTANLVRVHPPQVNITGTRIAVKGTAQAYTDNAAAQRIQSELESRIVGGDSRLTLDSAHPETMVEVSVLQCAYSETWENRQMTRRVKAGYKDSKGHDVYRDENVTVPFKIVKYVFNSAFKVRDLRHDRSLLADTINRTFKNEYANGDSAPDETSLLDGRVQEVVGEITHRLTPTKETVGVLLPRGSLETAAAFAEAGLWNKYLEALEKMPALAKPADEAYRQYALGVAYEALGYGADDHDTTLKYLEQASTHYNNAVDNNPREGYFTKAYQSILFSGKADAPLERVQSALVQYQKLKEFSDSNVKIASAAASEGAKSMSAGADAVTNDAVIEMLRAGLPEDVITTSIDSAKSTAFDVSPKGLIQLSAAKASKKLIQHIQAVATGGPVKKQESKTATAPKKKS